MNSDFGLNGDQKESGKKPENEVETPDENERQHRNSENTDFHMKTGTDGETEQENQTTGDNRQVSRSTFETVYTPAPPPKSEHSRRSGRGLKVPVAAVLLVALFAGLFGGFGGFYFYQLLLPEKEAGTKTEEKEPGNQNLTLYRQNTVEVVNLDSSGEPLSVAALNQKVSASVVAIETSVQMSSVFYGGFYVTKGAGSGVIIDTSGHVLTNYHVVDGATEIKVTLSNGNVYPAELIDGDEAMDIAVLKIEPTETLTPAVIGRSSSLLVGQDVVAIGNPLGSLPGSVTDGIVSALNRQISINGYTHTLIQTNAAVNPGNSGGGLFNLYGELVGIVNAKAASTGVEGLSFAIPIDSIFDSVEEILRDGYIHGRICLSLEISEITDMQEAFYQFYNQNTGLYILSSSYGEEVDLKKGDRIAYVNDTAVNTKSDLHAILSQLNPGDEVTLTVGRVVAVRNGMWTTYREEAVKVTVKVKEYVPASTSIRFE